MSTPVQVYIKRSIAAMLTSFSLGAFLVGGICAGFYFFHNRLVATEQKQAVQIEAQAKLDRRSALFKVVDEKLKDQKSQVRYEVADTIYNLCAVKGVPIELVLGVIETESNWKSDAFNGGAVGLMQLMESTARPYLHAERREYTREIMCNPVINVIVGISHLSDLHSQYVNNGLEKPNEFLATLCAYNSGKLISSQIKDKSLSNFGYAVKIKDNAAKFEAVLK